jgi:hypothetical protein
VTLGTHEGPVCTEGANWRFSPKPGLLYDIALALVHFLNGDMAAAERLRAEWLARRYD